MGRYRLLTDPQYMNVRIDGVTNSRLEAVKVLMGIDKSKLVRDTLGKYLDYVIDEKIAEAK